MTSANDEIKGNFDVFKGKWTSEILDVMKSLEKHNTSYIASYERLTSLNSWRELIIKPKVTESTYSFFCEAQNDAVTSHVLAQLGSWRLALRCLRSCIENVMSCEYYKDHPVELILWENGQHRMGFSELINYFRRHPCLLGLSDTVNGIDRLQKEYPILSRAVHSTSVSFRMTGPGDKTLLWSSDRVKLGVWTTREKSTIVGINLLLMALYREDMQGASQLGLRKAIALSISVAELRDAIKAEMGINLDL